jgi:hypothetical protein
VRSSAGALKNFGFADLLDGFAAMGNILTR